MKILFNSIFISSMLTLFFTSSFTFPSFAKTYGIKKIITNDSSTFYLSAPRKLSYSNEEMLELEKQSDLLIQMSEEYEKQYLEEMSKKYDAVTVIEIEEKFTDKFINCILNILSLIFPF